MTSRLLTACGAAVVALAAVALCNIQDAVAASAVTKDAKTGAFGYCTGADDAYAAMTCAQQSCEAAGGRNCKVVEGCPTPGHGAVARDRGARAIGSSCGKQTVAEARSEAMQRCAAQGANCKIVEIFTDGAGAAAATGTSQAAKAGAAQKPTTAPKTAAAKPSAVRPSSCAAVRSACPRAKA